MQNELDAKRIRATLKGMRPEEKPSRAEQVSNSLKRAFGMPAPEETPPAPPPPPPAEQPADNMPASLRAIITDRLKKIKARTQRSE